MRVFLGASGLLQLVWLGVVGAGLWLLASWLQLPISPSLDAVIGVITLLWLYFVVTVPWNMVFQAKQVLFDAQTSRQRGIQIDPMPSPMRSAGPALRCGSRWRCMCLPLRYCASWHIAA